MKTIKTLFILTGLLLCFATAQAQTPAADASVSTITVQGEGLTTVAPDTATIQIGINSSAVTARQAQEDNAKIAGDIRRSLTAAGIPDKNIRTSNYSFYSLRDNNAKKQPAPITGYMVNNMMRVTLNDIASAGQIIDRCLDAGANQINNVSFSKKNELSLKRAALQKAIEDAAAKADIIARALGKRIVRVVSVAENGVSVSQPYWNGMMLKEAARDAGTSIAPGDVDVSARVSVVYEIQ